MYSDTTSTTPFSSDTDSYLGSSKFEPLSPSSSSQELDDAVLTKTPTRSVVNGQTENEKTPTQTSVLRYRLSSKEDAEKSTSLSRRLFIIPLTCDNHKSLTDDLDLEEPQSHTRLLTHFFSAAVQRRASESAIVLNPTDWTKQLPMKILERIFVFYLSFLQASLHPVNKPYVVPCPTSGPLLLLQISKYWRDTAFASPLLWGSLSVGNSQPDIALLRSWLSRSRPAPLSLRLDLNLSPTNVEYVTTVLDLFAEHRERWQILDLRLDDVLANKLCTLLGFASNPSMIQVQRIRMDTELCNVRVISKMIFVLAGFPSLQEFVYVNSNRKSFSSHTVCSSPLWSRLTYIDIGAILSQLTCISFLTQCTSATSITFQSIRKSNSEIIPHIAAPISLPHLQHFDVVASTIEICTTILAHLTCQSLSSLSIVTASNVSETPAHLRDFLIRSACSLRLLNIFDWQMNIHTLFPLIRATSGAGVGSSKIIETLGIYSTEMPRDRDRFYEALRDEEESNGSLGIQIDRIDYWGSLNTFRTRIGWGKRPAHL